MSVPTDTLLRMSPGQAVDEVHGDLAGMPVFLAGSAVAAMHDTQGRGGYSDIDVFCPTQQTLVSSVQHLLSEGYTLDERHLRVWHRWLRHGFGTWHTNSIRLHSRSDVEVNVVYKLLARQPLTSLSQVLESFDFGLLGIGIEVESGTTRDLRPYLFPGMDLDGPLPLMPNKRDDWRNGFISQYNGLRQAMRYAKYWRYGFDMSLAKDDLATGYSMAAVYFGNHFDEDKRMLGDIYDALASRIDEDEIDELDEAYKELDLTDELDKIMEALV